MPLPPPTQTVVHFVASKNNLDIARRLFANEPPASARVRDKRGQYALHRAAAVGSVPMVNLLLQNKSPLSATDSDGQTALHHAVAEGHGEWCQSPPLVPSFERRVGMLDLDGLTNISGLGETAVALLKAGIEADKRDTEGHVALDLAPDKEVCLGAHPRWRGIYVFLLTSRRANLKQVKKYIVRMAEIEGVEL